VCSGSCVHARRRKKNFIAKNTKRLRPHSERKIKDGREKAREDFPREPSRLNHQTDAYGNKRYDKPQRKVEGTKVYQTDAYGAKQQRFEVKQKKGRRARPSLPRLYADSSGARPSRM